MTKDTQYSSNLEVIQAKYQVELLRQYQSATTDEMRDKIKSQLCYETNYLIEHNPVAIVIARLEDAIAKDAFRPRNLTLYQFATGSDFQYINGEFSTFDAKLSRMIKNNVPADELRRYLNKNLNQPACINVADQYVADWSELIAKYPNERIAVTNAGMSGDTTLYEEYCDKLAREMRDKIGIEHYVKVCVFDSWADAHNTTGLKLTESMNTSTGFCTLAWITKPEKAKGKTCYVIYIIRKKLYELLRNKTNPELYNDMMGMLAHEFGHIIDAASPNKGMLGAQTANIAGNVYEAPAKDSGAYAIAVGEVSSRTIQKFLIEKLQNTR